MAAATMANNALARDLHRAVRAAARRRGLRLAGRAGLDVRDPGRARARRVQVAVAREIALGRLGEGHGWPRPWPIWRRRLLIVGVAVTAAAVLLREPIADLISVPEEWAAAATAPTAVLWLLLSRRARRAAGRARCTSRSRGRSCSRPSGGWCSGSLLVALGLGVTGAYLGTPLSLAGDRARAVVGRAQARSGAPGVGAAARRLCDLVGGAWPAVLGLFLIAVLQNVDVIMVKRQIGGDAAGAYAAAAVAAKAVVWVAIGIGLYLLPEATRAARHGRGPAAGAGARAGRRGRGRRADADRLRAGRRRPCCGSRSARRPWSPPTRCSCSGCAMTLLAVGYLGVQYMLALGRVAFLPALAAVAVAEIALLGATRDRVAARRSPRSCSALQAAARAVRAGDRARPAAEAGGQRRRALRLIEGWLTEAQARAAGRRRGASAARRRGRRDRLLPRAARRSCSRSPPARWSRSTRTRAATAGRRRSRPTRRAATPTTRRSTRTSPPPASPTACGTCASSPPTPTATSTGPLSLLYVDGAHRFGPARADLARLGRARGAGRDDARARRVLVDRRHARAAGRRARGRALALRRADRQPRRVRAALRPAPAGCWAPSSRELPWFARNVAIKVLVVAGRRRWAERLGLDPAAPWPY